MTMSFNFVGRLRWLLVMIVLACGPVQFFIDDSLINSTCTVIAVVASIITFLYVFRIRRFRRAPFSCVMILGFNVSAFSAALVIQTTALRSLTYNLESALTTFSILFLTQILVIVVHIVYTHSRALLGVRLSLSRYVFRPMGLLKAPTNFQLWLFGFLGCWATVVSASTYTDSIDYGNVSGKFVLAYVPFAVAPFFIPLRSYLFGASNQSSGNWLSISAYSLLLIAVAMANNARATFSAGFLTLALACLVAVLSGNLKMTRKATYRGALLAAAAVPVFLTLSDLATAMVIARDERANVSSLDLVAITLSNFQDKELIAQRRRRDAAILTGDYNENYVSNPIFARFVYTKFVDINLTNAMLLSDGQAEAVRKGAWARVLALLPTPVIQYFGIDVDKTDLAFSSGDIYSFIARGIELGGFTTGSEIPDGLTIFGQFFWPVLALLVLVQFLVYDALSMLDRAEKLVVGSVALLNIVPIFTLGVMQESVANQIIAIVRGVPQLIVLYLLVVLGSSLLTIIWSFPLKVFQQRSLRAKAFRKSQ
jgi:hypothetical protein